MNRFKNGHGIIGFLIALAVFALSGFAEAAAVKNAKTVGAPFPNAREIVRVVYDFAQDGGATGALDLLITNSALVIVDFHAVVKTTATSGGSATVAVGVTGDTDHFIKATEGAVANITATTLFAAKPELTEGTPNTILPMLPVRLASGDKVLQTIGTAALTAGKIEYVFEIMRD